MMVNNKYITKNGVVSSGVKLYSTLKHLRQFFYVINNDTGHIHEYLNPPHNEGKAVTQWVYVNEDNEDNHYEGKRKYQQVMESLYE